MIEIVPIAVDGGYRWSAIREDDGMVVAVQPDFGDGGAPFNTEAAAVEFGKLWIRGALGAPDRPTDFSVIHHPGLPHATKCCGKEVMLIGFPEVGFSGGHTDYRWDCPLCGEEDGLLIVKESADEAVREIVLTLATALTEDPKLTFNVVKYVINAVIGRFTRKKEGSRRVRRLRRCLLCGQRRSVYAGRGRLRRLRESRRGR